MAYLDSRGLAYEVRDYLKSPLSLDELRLLARRLGRPVGEWTREKLGSDLELALLEIAAHPEHLQRPIVVAGDRAVVARDLLALQAWRDDETAVSG